MSLLYPLPQHQDWAGQSQLNFWVKGSSRVGADRIREASTESFHSLPNFQAGASKPPHSNIKHNIQVKRKCSHHRITEW